jgi:MFS family permease
MRQGSLALRFGTHIRAPGRALVGAAIFAIAVAAFSRIPLLPNIGSELSLGAGEIGLLTTAFGLGRLATDLPAGRLAEAISPSATLAGAGFVMAASSALLAGSQTMVQALVASALIGVASAISNTTGMYAFATATGAERRGASMAAYTTALLTGQMVGPALGGALGSLFGWRSALAVSAAIGAAVGILCLAWRQRGAAQPLSATRVAASSDDPVAPTTSWAPPPRRELIALAAAPFAAFFGVAGLSQTLIPLIGAGELDYSAGVIGLALGVGAASRFASTWIGGLASDRRSRKIVLVPSLALMALGATALALPPGPLGWGLGIVLIASGSSSISVAAAALADRVAAERLGRELGLFRLVGDLGLLLGPIVAGFLYQEAGPAPAAGASAAVFALSALAATLWVSDSDRDRVERPAASPLDREETGELLIE